MLSLTGPSALQGLLLMTLLTSICSTGFLLFGYDQGVMSGIVISPSWLNTVSHPSALMLGTITALYDVGAFFGAISAAFTAEPLGRKRTLLLGSIILIIGSVLLGTSFERVQFMVGRVVTGIGIGYICSVCPVYQAEISKTSQRGWQVACQLTTMLFGLMLAYWINYGFFFHSSSVQWRFPLLFQCVFAIYIVVVGIWMPDTPRWLLRHVDDKSVGMKVLARLRGCGVDDVDVQREVEDILDSLKLEAKEEGGWSDLFRGNGVMANKRFFLAVGIQWMQQMTGINIVTYYAPTIFKSSLGMSQEMALFLGCWTQVWYVLASLLTWYTIDRVGRRKLFIFNALGLTAVLVAEAVCVAIGTPGAAIGAVVFVWLFEGFFTWGWMTTVWIYPAEILPLKIRAKGASLAAAADFLGNFLVVEVTPVGLDNIGWKFYIVWAVLNLVNAIIVFLVYPETGGVQLEAIDRLFVDDGVKKKRSSGDGDGESSSSGDDTVVGRDIYDPQDLDHRWYRKVQWKKVGESIAASRTSRRRMATGEKGQIDIEDGRGAQTSALDHKNGTTTQEVRKSSETPGVMHVESVRGESSSGRSASGSDEDIRKGGHGGGEGETKLKRADVEYF